MEGYGIYNSETQSTIDVEEEIGWGHSYSTSVENSCNKLRASTSQETIYATLYVDFGHDLEPEDIHSFTHIEVKLLEA